MHFNDKILVGFILVILFTSMSCGRKMTIGHYMLTESNFRYFAPVGASGCNCLMDGQCYTLSRQYRAIASNKPTEVLALVISFTFVVYSHHKHS